MRTVLTPAILILAGSLVVGCSVTKSLSELDTMNEEQLRAEYRRWHNIFRLTMVTDTYQGEYARKLRIRIVAFHPEWPQEIRNSIVDSKFKLGMTTDQMYLSYGPPDYKNTTVSAGLVHEQWVYRGIAYFYFDNDVFVSLQVFGVRP